MKNIIVKVFILSALVGLSARNVFSQKPKKTETVAINGVEIYYEVYGYGAPFLILHGWTQSSASWKNLVPLFSSQYELYLVDLRGHGKSSPLTDDFSIQLASNDLLTLVDQLGLEQINAIGISFGGMVLLQLENLPEGLRT